MSKDKLLSDEELSRTIDIAVAESINIHSQQDQLSEYDYAQYLKDIKTELFDLINTQKRLYAESVIGEDEPIQPLTVKIPRARRYGTHRRNELRAEQRAMIK